MQESANDIIEKLNENLGQVFAEQRGDGLTENESFRQYDVILPPTATTRRVNFFQHDLGSMKRLLYTDKLEDIPTIPSLADTSGAGSSGVGTTGGAGGTGGTGGVTVGGNTGGAA